MAADGVRSLPKVTLKSDEAVFHYILQQVTKENIYWVHTRNNVYLTQEGSSQRIDANASGLYENLEAGKVYLVHGDIPQVGAEYKSLQTERKRRLWYEQDKLASEGDFEQKKAAARATADVVAAQKAEQEAIATARVQAEREKRNQALEARLAKLQQK
eukprot:TRINITY_DN4119_c0_g1_i2.p1 TRINITY_DN4119_c0_g1~~TRINITY_DN4119_c0_g1_i2.p1  ORF type:complete len:158 (-),score=36.07 TRINITY_DN4119_c0_g1_i2:27-500(-)